MVTVSSYAVRENSEGNSYVVLFLQGDLELVQSMNTGNYYATARKCAISSTFDESMAAMMIGKQIPGTIVKEACEPYEYTIQETGEQVTLSHRYVYTPQEQTVPAPKVTEAPRVQPMNFLGSSSMVPLGEA